MSEPAEKPTRRPPEPPDEKVRQQYFQLLVSLVDHYGTTSKAVNDELKKVAANPEQPIPLGLIDIIRELCDCKAIIVILECLCKWLTHG